MYKWVGTFLLIWFLYSVRRVFPPFIVGGIIAYLLLPVVRFFSSKCKLSIGATVAIMYLTGGVLGYVLARFFLPSLSEQFESLLSHRHEIVAAVLTQASTNFGWDLNVQYVTDNLFANAEQSIGQPSEIVHIGGLLSRGLLSLLVCTVSSIYFLVDSDRVGNFVLRLIPENRQMAAQELLNQMNRMFTRYVRGQLILILLMSVVAGLFLHYVIHMRYAVPIAILSGFLEIIPVLGPILATTTATLVGFAQFGTSTAISIIIFYTIARWAEDYVIIPKVIGHAVELHPLAVIFAVLCGETLAGVLGMLIAIPVAAAIKVVLDFVYPVDQTAAAHKD